MMKQWRYVQARRGTTLPAFLRGVSTMSEALELFRSKRIIPPPVEEIQEVLGLEPEVEEPSNDDPPQKEYDDLVIIDTTQEVVDS